MCLVEKEEELLSRIPENGEAVGNIWLLRVLGWPEEDYWATRNRLIERGMLELGRGRGGSVRKPVKVESVHDQAAATESAEFIVDEFKKEIDLYPSIRAVIAERWTKEYLYDNSIVQIIGQLGSKGTGKWSRPDLAVAAVSTYPYVPGRHFDIVTFEVKTPDNIDITAVYEALAHLRSATRSYVFFYVPVERREELETALVDVYAEAKKHGVGVITAGKVDDYATWEEVIEPTRSEPDPRRLNDFLAKQFTQEQREQIMKWFK